MKIIDLNEDSTLAESVAALAQISGPCGERYRILRDEGVHCHLKAAPERHRGAQKQCYSNAANLALALGDDRCWYVEGVISVRGIPIDHAWVYNYHLRQQWELTISLKPGETIEAIGLPVKHDALRRFLLTGQVYTPCIGHHELGEQWRATSVAIAMECDG